jgi:1-acyl-sn-glycerol-3-phosphate acyltransferase
LLYAVARFVLRLYIGALYRVRVQGIENVPASGAGIICANHLSWLDPPLLAVVAPRQVHFMAKEELFLNLILGPILRRAEIIPVRRGQSDRSAIRRAIQVLREGRILGLFPEGTRGRLGELAAFANGAAYLAVKCGAPIIPVGVRSDYRPFSEIHVRVGPSIHWRDLAQSESGAAAGDGGVER